MIFIEGATWRGWAARRREEQLNYDIFIANKCYRLSPGRVYRIDGGRPKNPKRPPSIAAFKHSAHLCCASGSENGSESTNKNSNSNGFAVYILLRAPKKHPGKTYTPRLLDCKRRTSWENAGDVIVLKMSSIGVEKCPEEEEDGCQGGGG